MTKNNKTIKSVTLIRSKLVHSSYHCIKGYTIQGMLVSCQEYVCDLQKKGLSSSRKHFHTKEKPSFSPIYCTILKTKISDIDDFDISP